MPLTRDDFELEVGLADDFDGVIADAYFGTKAEYAAKTGSQDPMLILAFDSPDLEQSFEQAYSLGSKRGWETGKGGKEVISSVKPEAHRFNMNSRGGELVGRMVQLIGAGDKAKGQDFFVQRGFTMNQAGFYTGLNFHWKREKRPTVGGTESDVLLPVAYLGIAVGKATPTADDVVKALLDLAAGKTERELKQAILKDGNLSKNEDLKNRVFNKGLLADLVTQGKLVLGPDGKFV